MCVCVRGGFSLIGLEVQGLACMKVVIVEGYDVKMRKIIGGLGLKTEQIST